jgi:hypothetical protein
MGVLLSDQSHAVGLGSDDDSSEELEPTKRDARSSMKERVMQMPV